MFGASIIALKALQQKGNNTQQQNNGGLRPSIMGGFTNFNPYNTGMQPVQQPASSVIGMQPQVPSQVQTQVQQEGLPKPLPYIPMWGMSNMQMPINGGNYQFFNNFNSLYNNPRMQQYQMPMTQRTPMYFNAGFRF